MPTYSHYLFLDTETSGIPESWNAPTTEVDKWPYIVQIAWMIYDNEGRKLKEREFYIKAKDYHIQQKSLEIHGISEEMANSMGVERKDALKALYRDLRRYQPLIVGHFITLDLHMIQAGFARAGIKNIIKNYPSFCTMRATSDYMHISHRQYPKLSELYESLFKEKMKNQHNAYGDAQAVADCFFELVRRQEVDDALIARQMKNLQKEERRKKKTGCGLTIFIFGFIFITYTLWLL
jgi:DNA polymerase-3 subunit epsilon